MYIHVTFTLNSWLTTFPNPLSAVQRYVPEAVLLMFGKFQLVPWCRTSPLLPSSSNLVKVIYGPGLPVALQNNIVFDPSRTVWSPLTLVRLTGTKNSNTIGSLYQLILLQTVFLYRAYYIAVQRYEMSLRVLKNISLIHFAHL